MFPYSTIDSIGYIFSAANNACSLEEITKAFNGAIISESYKDQLIANFYDAGQMPNPAVFKPV